MNETDRIMLVNTIKQTSATNGTVRRVTGIGWQLQYQQGEMWHRIPAPQPIIHLPHSTERGLFETIILEAQNRSVTE